MSEPTEQRSTQVDRQPKIEDWNDRANNVQHRMDTMVDQLRALNNQLDGPEPPAGDIAKLNRDTDAEAAIPRYQGTLDRQITTLSELEEQVNRLIRIGLVSV